MTAKVEQLPLRLTSVHKEALRLEADRLGLSMNELVTLWVERHCRDRELKRYLRLQRQVRALAEG